MSQKKPASPDEAGIEIPFEQINPETLRSLIAEFVSRDGVDWGDAGGTLEDKIDQVLRQLRGRQAKVVFDQKSQTANIITCR